MLNSSLELSEICPFVIYTVLYVLYYWVKTCLSNTNTNTF